MYKRSMHKKFIALLSSLFIFIGCSNTKPYPNVGTKNLHVVTSDKAEGILERFGIDLHIYKIKRDCTEEYLGSIDLKTNPNTLIGLPQNEFVALKVEFSFSHINTSGSSITQRILMPNPKYSYKLEVERANSISNVELFEVNPKNGTKKEIYLPSLPQCN